MQYFLQVYEGKKQSFLVKSVFLSIYVRVTVVVLVLGHNGSAISKYNKFLHKACKGNLGA